MYHRFRLGRFDCLSLSAGTLQSRVANLFANAPSDALIAAGVRAERLPSAQNCLLIDGATLVDCGMDAGPLLVSFAEARVDPASVHTLILTHAHPDHIGGAVAFPRARCLLTRIEWDYWHSEQSLAIYKPGYAQGIREMLAAIADRLTLIDAPFQVAEGIDLDPIYGHSPGMVTVKLSSEGESLCCCADVFSHELHLDYPDWNTAFDDNQALAAQARRDLKAAGGRLFAYHFEFPGLYDLG